MALLRMGFSVRLNDKIKKTHFENFPGEGKVLYMMDDLEGEDAFYVFRGEDLSRQNGYYIYYEKKKSDDAELSCRTKTRYKRGADIRKNDGESKR